MFNSNMGCIEIKVEKNAPAKAEGLTVTWDVFKSV